jgi:hypothetical protein
MEKLPTATPTRTLIARFERCQVAIPAKKPDRDNIRVKPPKTIEGTDITIAERLQWPVFGSNLGIVNFYAYGFSVGEKGIADIEVWERVRNGRVHRYVDFRACEPGTVAEHRISVVNVGQYKVGDVELGAGMYLRIADGVFPAERKQYVCSVCSNTEERAAPYDATTMGPYCCRACRNKQAQAEADKVAKNLFRRR